MLSDQNPVINLAREILLDLIIRPVSTTEQEPAKIDYNPNYPSPTAPASYGHAIAKQTHVSIPQYLSPDTASKLAFEYAEAFFAMANSKMAKPKPNPEPVPKTSAYVSFLKKNKLTGPQYLVLKRMHDYMINGKENEFKIYVKDCKPYILDALDRKGFYMNDVYGPRLTNKTRELFLSMKQQELG